MKRAGECSGRWGGAVLACALLAACGDSKGPTSLDEAAAGTAAVPSENTGIGGEHQDDSLGPETRRNAGFSESYEPETFAVAEPDGAGGRGEPAALVAPYGTSTTCGDAILGAAEECDDGAGSEADGCTAQCQTRDEAVASVVSGVDRYLGAGRHPVAGNGDRGFITTYLEESDEGPAVGATLFDIWGKPQHHVVVSDGGAPIHEANPVAAELPDGSYAVAWTDLDSDGSDLGIALRKVKADGTLEGLRVANQGREFSQQDPDLLWTGTRNRPAGEWRDQCCAACLRRGGRGQHTAADFVAASPAGRQLFGRRARRPVATGDRAQRGRRRLFRRLARRGSHGRSSGRSNLATSGARAPLVAEGAPLPPPPP
jgi:cysteine-rich repeat protein